MRLGGERGWYGDDADVGGAWSDEYLWRLDWDIMETDIRARIAWSLALLAKATGETSLERPRQCMARRTLGG